MDTMLITRLIFAVLVPFATASCIHGTSLTTGHGTHFGYSGLIGPLSWHKLDRTYGVCASGLYQSPIELSEGARYVRRVYGSDEVSFELPYITDGKTVILNNGHTIQVNVKEGNFSDSTKNVYDAQQFHFHTPSEHRFGDEFYAMELHFVFKSKSLPPESSDT